MVEQTAEPTRSAINDVFALADIDDITLDRDADVSEQVEIIVTDRVFGDHYYVKGETVEKALEEAALVLVHQRGLQSLHEAGLSGSDIADLTGRDERDLDEEFMRTPEGEAWRRGYESGVIETSELYTDALARQRLEAEPVAAAVGEPYDDEELTPIRIIPVNGSYLALILPAQVAHD